MATLVICFLGSYAPRQKTKPDHKIKCINHILLIASICNRLTLHAQVLNCQTLINIPTMRRVRCCHGNKVPLHRCSSWQTIAADSNKEQWTPNFLSTDPQKLHNGTKEREHIIYLCSYTYAVASPPGSPVFSNARATLKS